MKKVLSLDTFCSIENYWLDVHLDFSACPMTLYVVSAPQFILFINVELNNNIASSNIRCQPEFLQEYMNVLGQTTFYLVQLTFQNIVIKLFNWNKRGITLS